ncbi:16S rRNA pseudouridine(516) synthase, partial [Neisseria meningitidis]
VQHVHRRRFAHLETDNLKPGEWTFIECPKF